MAITKEALQKMADLHSLHVEHDYRLMGGSKEQTPRTPMSEVFALALANLEAQKVITNRLSMPRLGVSDGLSIGMVYAEDDVRAFASALRDKLQGGPR
jgi:hypothetical protein